MMTFEQSVKISLPVLLVVQIFLDIFNTKCTAERKSLQRLD